MIEVIGEYSKEEYPLPEITGANDSKLIGELRVLNGGDMIKDQYEFTTRLQQRHLMTFVTKAYYDKITSGQYYISILIKQ